MKNKKIILFLILIVLITGCNSKTKSNKETEEKVENVDYDNKIDAVASLEDKIKPNSVWCGTFNLVWNMLKDEYVKGDVIISPSTEEINNLNKSTFNKDYLNENNYYTKFGKQTIAVKKEIETAIKEKFNQTSDILDNFTWEEKSNNDLMYAMLYKKFTFEVAFNQLDNSTFNNKNDYKYFGINSSKRDGSNQVRVLYYNNENDYAVKISTKENDEIILMKGTNGNSFLDTYNNISNSSKNYNGITYLNDNDTLTIPYIKFNTFKSFDSLKNKEFKYADGSIHIISDAVQTIKLDINEKGGEIKSEAAIITKNTAMPREEETRHFNFNSNFTLFLVENDANLPYFAAYITSLDEFQKNDSN